VTGEKRATVGGLGSPDVEAASSSLRGELGE